MDINFNTPGYKECPAQMFQRLDFLTLKIAETYIQQLNEDATILHSLGEKQKHMKAALRDIEQSQQCAYSGKAKTMKNLDAKYKITSGDLGKYIESSLQKYSYLEQAKDFDDFIIKPYVAYQVHTIYCAGMLYSLYEFVEHIKPSLLNQEAKTEKQDLSEAVKQCKESLPKFVLNNDLVDTTKTQKQLHELYRDGFWLPIFRKLNYHCPAESCPNLNRHIPTNGNIFNDLIDETEYGTSPLTTQDRDFNFDTISKIIEIQECSEHQIIPFTSISLYSTYVTNLLERNLSLDKYQNLDIKKQKLALQTQNSVNKSMFDLLPIARKYLTH